MSDWSIPGDWGNNANEWTVEKKGDWASASGDNWLDEFVEKNAAKKNSSLTSSSAKTSASVSGESRAVFLTYFIGPIPDIRLSRKL